jgi:hypothetical protein
MRENDMSLAASDSDMQREINRGALEQLWDALITGQETAKIYRDDAELRAPQDVEKTAGQADSRAHGQLETGEQLVKVNSIVGDGWLWVSECETLWHQKKTLLVSVAEMYDGKIVRETRYRVPRQIGSS